MKVLITGGSGFLAAHLINHLQTHSVDIVSEILTIDRRSTRKIFDDFDGQGYSIPIVHQCCDLNDVDRMETLIKMNGGVQVVFHLARKSFEYIYTVDQETLNQRYWNDNYKATVCLLEAMFRCNVERLVYVGAILDAYASLPAGDNFGSSETIYSGLPPNYFLGKYGETRAKAEILARQRNGEKLPNGKIFHGLFLRPTFVYGEGETKLALALDKMARSNGGIVSALEGPSSGMHQYIYAGNLAAFMEYSMRALLEKPEISGEHFYCMDDTICAKFKQFCGPFVEVLGYKMGPDKNNYLTYWSYLWNEFVARFRGKALENQDISAIALRFLFSYCIGFSNRKQSLLLGFRPQAEKENIEKTLEWVRSQFGNNTTDGKSEELLKKRNRRMG